MGFCKLSVAEFAFTVNDNEGNGDEVCEGVCYHCFSKKYCYLAALRPTFGHC